MTPLEIAGKALIHLLAISHLCGVRGVALPASLGSAISKIAQLAAEDNLEQATSLLKNLGNEVFELPEEIMAHVQALLNKPASIPAITTQDSPGNFPKEK
jgi:hypothetical protein